MKIRMRHASFIALGLTLARCGESTTLADFSVKDGAGNDVSLAKYKNTPALLITNVASQCGYTDSNYRELQILEEKGGVSVLAFPCNQFGRQEPGTWEEISRFVDEQYGVTFPVMEKIEVNGNAADPLFDWLKEASGDESDIPWNFSKFLVICGVTVKRYSHGVNPLEIEKDMKDIPAACPTTSAEEL